MLKEVMILGVIVVVVICGFGIFVLRDDIELPPVDHHNDTVPPVDDTVPPVYNLSNYTGILMSVAKTDYCVAVFESRTISFGKMFVGETYDILRTHIGQEITVFYNESSNGIKYMGLEVVTPVPPIVIPNESLGEYTYTGRLDWVAWPGPHLEGQPGPDYCLVVFNMMNRVYDNGNVTWEGTNITFCDRWASEACSNLQGYVGYDITLIYNVTEEGNRFGGVRQV